MEKIGIEIEVLNEKNMDKLGMHVLLEGRSTEKAILLLKWNGSPNSKKNIAYVGKGVCFDSGGLFKNPRGMIDMKEDMGGAGIVVGTMKAQFLKRRNIIGLWVWLKICQVQMLKDQVILLNQCLKKL